MTEPRMMTFRGGGWVLCVMALVCAVLIVWAVAPAMFVNPKPGDGRDIDTYGFDLTNLAVPRELVGTPMRTRDMVPVMDDVPGIVTAKEIQRINEEERGKYIVSADRIVGVVVNGEARAYPISVLNVHEVIHDTLGGIPIAVTYSWLGDCVRVFDRRLPDGRVLRLGISGLVYNANTLFYDRDQPEGGLWLQFTGRAVSGSDIGKELSIIPAQLASWAQWREMHEETTVITRDAAFGKRYRKASPDQYFRSPHVGLPVEPMPSEDEASPKVKDRVLVIEAPLGSGHHRVYPLTYIAARAHDQLADRSKHRWPWTDTVNGVTVQFEYDAIAHTAVAWAESPIGVSQSLWFLWHAMRPDVPSLPAR